MKQYQLWRNQGRNEGWAVSSYDTTEELLKAIQGGGIIYGEEFVITEKLDLLIL